MLLFFPTRFFCPANARLRPLSHPPDSMEFGPTRWWWLTTAQALDFVVGGVGAFLVRQYAFIAPPPAAGGTATGPLLAAYGVLLAAMLYRMPVRGRKLVCMAPAGLLLGVIWAMVPGIVALVSTVFIVCSAAAFRSLAAAFVAGACTVVATGLAFNAPRLELVLIAALAGVPVVVALVSFRALALPSRL